MAMATATRQASEAPQQAWIRWQREHADVLEGAKRSQQVLLEAAVRFVAVITSVESTNPFRRVEVNR